MNSAWTFLKSPSKGANTPDNNQPRRPRTIPENKLHWMWGKIFLKISLCMHHLHRQRCMKNILGEKNYNKIFNPTVESASTAQPAQTPFRILHGQVVGKPLKPGEGKEDLKKKSMDPVMCQHPDEAMKKRGNNEECMWWLCAQCCSRWERRKISEISTLTGHPSGFNILTFGKFSGSMFQQVYDSSPDYCQWVLDTLEKDGAKSQSKNFVNFAEYILNTKMAEQYAADEFSQVGGDQTEDMEFDDIP